MDSEKELLTNILESEDFIKHYGVLGMKWGVRRYQPYRDGKKGVFLGKKRKRQLEDTKKQVELVKKGATAYKNAMGKKHARKIEGTKKQVELVKKGAGAYKDAMGKKQARKVEDTKKQIAAVKGLINKKDKAANGAKDMSDAELRAKINRLQMEKQYTQLTTKEKSKGKKAVENVLKTASTSVAVGYTIKGINKGVDEIVKKVSR